MEHGADEHSRVGCKDVHVQLCVSVGTRGNCSNVASLLVLNIQLISHIVIPYCHLELWLFCQVTSVVCAACTCSSSAEHLRFKTCMARSSSQVSRRHTCLSLLVTLSQPGVVSVMGLRSKGSESSPPTIMVANQLEVSSHCPVSVRWNNMRYVVMLLGYAV